MLARLAVGRSLGLASVKSARAMSSRLYTESHEYVDVKDDVATVGITDYAQDKLGDVVAVNMPKIGANFTAGARCLLVESVKVTADVYAPINGSVVEVNKEIEAHPEYVNESPFEKGWLVKLKIADKSQLAKLLDEAAYKKITE